MSVVRSAPSALNVSRDNRNAVDIGSSGRLCPPLASSAFSWSRSVCYRLRFLSCILNQEQPSRRSQSESRNQRQPNLRAFAVNVNGIEQPHCSRLEHNL